MNLKSWPIDEAGGTRWQGGILNSVNGIASSAPHLQKNFLSQKRCCAVADRYEWSLVDGVGTLYTNEGHGVVRGVRYCPWCGEAVAGHDVE